MRIGVGELELEVRHGVTTAQLVAFARDHGADVPDRPWCGVTRLRPEHTAGEPPLVAFARLTSQPGPDARPRPGAHLAVVGGPDSGSIATLTDGLIVGRGPNAGLRLRDPTVGAEHAVFIAGTVRDLGSPNGTTVGRRRVRRRTPVGPGDVIRIGATTLAVCSQGGVAPHAAEPPVRATSRHGGVLAGGAAGLSMAAFAVMTGNWPLALIGVALPLAGFLARGVPRPRAEPPHPLIDVTGTLGLPPLPSGATAVFGPRGLARAVTLASGRPPASARHWEPWMSVLEPAAHEVYWLAEGHEPPSWVQVEVRARGEEVTVAAHGESASGPLPLVSFAAAEAAARRIAARRERGSVPASVRWSELDRPPSGRLGVRLGVGNHGLITLDLVTDGPHLLVAGTTGSGKSEALRTIIGSLAHDFSPQEVTFALIDFKGGAGLASCVQLPHVGSLLTDLEPHLARRCLLALAAELGDRKRAAAKAGATSFDDWHERRPPRLVVVVDEFQEIAAVDRDFLPELARLAAQGRSLGIHLVLATQRPAGAVGAAIRANIGATLALRTASEAESRDLIGSDAAALIPATLPGRAILLRGGESAEVQVALPLADVPAPVRLADQTEPAGRDLFDAAVVPRAPTANPLWLPPLPEHIEPPRRTRNFTLGVADLPHSRSRAPLLWDPAAGPLIVAGPPRSGRTTALESVAAIASELGMTPVWVPKDPRLAVRTLALATEVHNAVLLLDDAAQTLAAASAADPEAIDLLSTAMLRLPTAIVVPSTWASHRLTAGAGLRLAGSGFSVEDDTMWGIPQPLRALPLRAGRMRAGTAQGWCEAQVAWSRSRTSARPRLVEPLPTAIATVLPERALGVGTDAAVPVLAPRGPAAVVGPAGAERDAVSRRLAIVTGAEPVATENAFSLGGPGLPAPVTTVCVQPTARSVREITRSAPRGLVEPAHVPFRTFAIIDGVPMALQVLPG